MKQNEGKMQQNEDKMKQNGAKMEPKTAHQLSPTWGAQRDPFGRGEKIQRIFST